MSGERVQKWRERRDLSRRELADLLNSALGTKYRTDTVARWEKDATRPPSKKVLAFLDELDAQSVAGLADQLTFDDPAPAPEQPSAPADTPPGSGAPDGPFETQPPMIAGRSAWTKACEELWEMVAMGVGMVGAAVGNQALIADGQIIAADKQALGAAWGKLAETNETFRRMLVGMTEGGAWLQVAMVTGTTLSKCWQTHAAIAAHNAAQAAANGYSTADVDESAPAFG